MQNKKGGFVYVSSNFELFYPEEVKIKPYAILKSIHGLKMSPKELLDIASSSYETVILDSGGYQSKSGKLTLSNIHKHIDFYYSIMELLPKYNNVYIFSLDFPPCMPQKANNETITPELSSKYTLETYSHIANYGDRDKIIIISHFANSYIIDGWYNIFEKLQDKLREFKYFATGVLVKHVNTPLVSYYTMAKKFLEFFNIKPKKFHFLGTTNPNLLYPIYQDKELELVSYDRITTGYLLQLKVPIKYGNLIRLFNISARDNKVTMIYNAIPVYKEYNYKYDDLIDKLSRLNPKKQDRDIIIEFKKYDTFIMTLTGDLLNKNKLHLGALDYNIETDKKIQESKLTLDQFKSILKTYFDKYQS